MRLPGFVTTESAAITVNADDRLVRFETAIEPQGQADRDHHRDGEVTVLTPQAGRQPAGSLGRVTITPHEVPSGRLDLTVNGLPPGMEARVNDQPIARDGAELAFRRDEPIVIYLQRTENYTGIGGGQAERSEINIAARARSPQEGSVSAILRVEPIVGQPRISFENPNENIELVDLEEGRSAIRLRVVDPLVQGSVSPADISAQITGPWTARWIAAKVQTAGDLHEIAPSVSFPVWPRCCLIGLFGLGEHRLDVAYRRPDGTASSASTTFLIGDRDGWTRCYCLRTLGIVFLILYFLGFLWYRITAVAFPRNSSLMFERNDSGMPDREALRRGLSFATLKALAWPFYFITRTAIRQRYSKSELDLVFEASTRDSTLIRPKGDQWPPFTLHAQPLSDQGGGKDGRPIEPVEMNYGDPYGDVLVEQRNEGLVVTLVREHSDFPGSWSRYRRRR
jgi:hypothetical protein